MAKIKRKFKARPTEAGTRKEVWLILLNVKE